MAGVFSEIAFTMGSLSETSKISTFQPGFAAEAGIIGPTAVTSLGSTNIEVPLLFSRVFAPNV